MMYENIETYLNEEVRRLIKWAIEKGDIHTALEVLDFEFHKHMDLNAVALGYESYIEKELKKTIDFKKMREYMAKCGYDKEVNFDKLPSPYSKEELAVLKKDFQKDCVCSYPILNPSNLGATLRRLRLLSGLSQHQLAKKAKTTQQQISLIELGKVKDVLFSTLYSILSVLGYSLACLPCSDGDNK